MISKILKLFLCLFPLIFFGCTWSQIMEIDKKEKKSDPCEQCLRVYYVKPPDWVTQSIRDSVINIYSNYFRGIKIFLDPGHGGEDRKNKGPKGQAIEADLNLKVALYLQEYLQKAGVIVYMSRDKDTTVSLEDRSKLANNSGADIFVSIHHNAPGKSGDIYTNYTSTYYHATPKDFEYEHCDQDIAKYVQRDLAYVSGNSGGLGSFDGTYSDYWIYAKSGFSVLRNTTIPKILLECAFFTSEYEEQRLIQEDFNKIQAWGIFRGLGKYLRQGIVTLDFHDGPVELLEGDQQIRLDIFTQNIPIDTGFCIAQINNEFAKSRFVTSNNETFLMVEPTKKLSTGEHDIRVVVKNINGNHSFPFRKKIVVK